MCYLMLTVVVVVVVGGGSDGDDNDDDDDNYDYDDGNYYLTFKCVVFSLHTSSIYFSPTFLLCVCKSP